MSDINDTETPDFSERAVLVISLCSSIVSILFMSLSITVYESSKGHLFILAAKILLTCCLHIGILYIENVNH